ncbi:MAG: hypothetical protein ACE14V_14930 [bacterium]
MHKKVLGILFICVLLSGCVVPSLNPLYTDKDLILLPGLEGTWIDTENCFWKFEKKDEHSYRLSYAKDSEPVETGEIFDAHIIRLDNHIFMDLFPREGAFRDDKGMEVFHYVPTHTFSKVLLHGDGLEINMLNPEWIREMDNDRLVFVGHEQIENGILLTANSKELQKFISAYADDSKAFEKPVWLLKRYIKKPTISESTVSQDTGTISIDTATTAVSISTTAIIAPVSLGNGGTKGCSILYFAPLSVQGSPGNPVQLNIILDNPMGTYIDNLGLWIRYNQKAVKFIPESSYGLDTNLFPGWVMVNSYYNPAKGEIYFQYKTDEEANILSGILGKLEFIATGKESISQIRFRFNRWESFPNTFITYKNRDVLGKNKDHNDGTIGAMFRIQRDN